MGVKPISIIQELPTESSKSDDELFVIEEGGTLKHDRKGQFFVPPFFIHMQGSSIIECQLDTGATCNVMSMADLCAVLHNQNPPLQPETSQLRCYDNSVINTLGQRTLQCCYNAKTYQLPFKVIEGNQKPLLSGTTCMELGLITVHTVCNVTSTKLIEQYDDVFKGLGCLGNEHHIEIDKSLTPVQHVPQRVPVAMKEHLKHKLAELTEQGIITKVEEPTPWISNMVAIMKPSKLRLCIDPRDLNKETARISNAYTRGAPPYTI